MDITLTWALPINQLPTDEYDVLYKVWDPSGTNNWVLANTTPLPPTTTTYTITGLDPNTIYRVAVTKSCLGGGTYVDEATYVNIVCPLISFWQGPVVNSEQTLFYSVNYPNATHVTNTEILVYDTTFDDRFLADCGAGPTAIPIGRTSYQISDGCTTPTVVSCVKQILEYKTPNTGTSGIGYYGLDTTVGFDPFLCDGATGDPLLFRAGNTYKFELTTIIDTVTLGVTIDFSTFDTSCNVVASAPVYTMSSNPVPDSALLSSALCFDSLTGLVSFTTEDGTGTTNINDYSFTYSTSDGSVTLPLLDSAGNIVSSYNGSYNIYAPIKIQTYAPGGGNSVGYTITNAIVLGGNTTYTYSGGTNAFTVGQEVFVSSVNPIAFNFSTISKVITAATNNSFTVSFSPVGAYQTGGTASGYTELTDGMTITVDLQPTQNVITLTNQNYAGLTLIQALTQVATAINTVGIYTASAVVIAGLPYLKIDAPDSTYTSASVIFEGPNILTKGAPDILETSVSGTTYGSYGSVQYNGFLYASYDTATATIVGSDINNFTVTANYSHPIDLMVCDIGLVPQAPPTTAYALERLESGGDHSLNIATNSNTGYVYIADNTTVSIYDGATLKDSEDLSTLLNGPTTPIRLMEYNTTDDYLYVFTDGSSSNFRIILNPSVGTWQVGHVGTYAQTNYINRGTITPWNNLTTGSTAAEGTVTGSPVVPIPLGTIPNPPNAYQSNSASFQDTAKTAWNTPPPGVVSYSAQSYYVYNSTQNSLGEMFFYGGAPYIYPGITGGTTEGTINITRGITTSGATTPFLVSNGDSYGIFSRNKIVDYNATFASRTWANTSRYLIESGRNVGSNGFLNTLPINITNTTLTPDSYSRNLPTGEKALSATIGLDGTSTYLVYEITDGGTCYNPNSNKIFVSLDAGLVQAIANSGSITSPIQLYKDFPTNTIPVEVPLQMVADPNSDLVYGIARDARSNTDDMNIYVFNESSQVAIINGSGLWNENICGQISIDSDFLYFTGKHTRNFYQYNVVTEVWSIKVVPSLYEKLDGFTYGDGSIIERIQGATYMGGGKFVIMNYLQQTFFTELKYTYDVANLFVYDFITNTIDQALIGTAVNTYSGASNSYNLNYYGEGFGINDYNNDYCYGGLSIKVNSAGKVFWKKSISDQVYLAEGHAESGVAQIWGRGQQGTVSGKLIRIWNIQNDGLGTLVPSKRTILDMYSTIIEPVYDSYYNKVLCTPTTSYSSQFYLINPKTLGGLHGVNILGEFIKFSATGQQYNVGLSPSASNLGKKTSVYGVTVTPANITYFVKPFGFSISGVFPHHYAVGEVVKISGIVSSPVDQLNFPNPNTPANAYATILSVTPTSFTVANTYNATATYTSGGTVEDSKWITLVSSQGINRLKSNQNGQINLLGTIYGTYGSADINTPYSSFNLKYEPSDILTQRENPEIITLGLTSTVCSATPDQFFTYFTAGFQTSNSFMIHVPSQNNYWVLGTKNPTCQITGITNATYDPIAQTVRYYINNSFLVGKIVNISFVSPATYNLNGVTITAVDTANSPQQWFEISYTGANPGTFVPSIPIGGTVLLSPFYILRIFNDTTFATIATIDLGFINDYVKTLVNSFASLGPRFQYSSSTEEIYLSSGNTAEPVYIFSTLTNSLVRSSTFNRMVLSYTKLTNIFTLENVNGIPYFNGATPTDTPTRRWFRLTAGNRTYINDVHNELNIIVNDGSTTTTDNYNLYSFSNLSDTFGQWKVTTSTTWASIPGGSNITVNANEIIEFTMFSTTNTLVSVENVTTSTVYDIPSYNNLATFPTYNTLNSVLAFVIQADSVNLSNGDVLQFTFENPQNPTCPFINSVTINF